MHDREADTPFAIKKAEKICEVNVLEDPDYFVAIDNFRQAQNNLKTAL